MTTTTLAPDPTTSQAPDDAAPAVPARRPQFPLGWLRGVAALAVVTFHAYQHNRDPQTWAWPWDGLAHQLMLGTDLFVDMFFVLSGLVLWLPIAAACAEGDASRPGRVLLMRRMARLLPLYYAIVLSVWVLTNPSLPGNWQDLAMHLTFTHVYSDQYIFWTDGPAWSLAVEFHFYLLMALAVPVVNAVVHRQSSRRARLWTAASLPVLCAAITVGYLTWATLSGPYDPTDWSRWFSPLSRGVDFGAGMALGVLVAAGVRLRGAVRAGLGITGLTALAALVVLRPMETVASEWWHPLYAVAVAVALAGIVLHDGPWSSAWSWKPLVWVGSLGYGIYLIHEPVMRLLGTLGVLPGPRPGAFFLVTAVLVAVPAAALAWVSSRTLEPAGLRLLAMTDRHGQPRDYYQHLAEEDRLEKV
ncbi:acyltransferase family protein [Nocardioides mangrovi]|uniref:Acyltransferase n=1 Tax=Nocardioides mangrovi TaxID=2874580 RepID=A0ABS7UF77_9ACTN|nr:acyltransferase [Nocardioides mangrovi]MBZ5739302.1 acyltransferase [Nocardioides mangrovi]